MEIDPPDTLFGLYQGIPLTERGSGYGNALPDRILIFQGPHEREAEDEDDLVISIGETLIHEIGHYFGLSEEEIEEIEERYWRGEDDEDDDARPRARKRFGQHFLERAGSTRWSGRSTPAADDVFLEIGPGRGGADAAAGRGGRRVVGVEIDRDLAADLAGLCPAEPRPSSRATSSRSAPGVAR